MKYGGGSFFYRVGHFSITENLWKSDPGVIILYRIVTRGSLYPRVNILYDTGMGNLSDSNCKHTISNTFCSS